MSKELSRKVFIELMRHEFTSMMNENFRKGCETEDPDYRRKCAVNLMGNANKLLALKESRLA